MSKLLYLISVIIPFSIAFACDLDGDGIDDRVAFSTDSAGGQFNYIQSSDGQAYSKRFGLNFRFPALGKYYLNDPRFHLAFVDNSNFWNILATNEDQNFGRSDANYMAGRDFNADGISDLVKFVNRCNRGSKYCLQSTITRGNFLFVKATANKTFLGFDGTPSILLASGFMHIFPLNANDDGRDDVCSAVYNRRRPKTFQAICKDLFSGTIVRKQNIGEIYNRPLALKVASGSDAILLWRAFPSKSKTDITINYPDNTVQKFSIPALGKVIVGDWLVDGSAAQQVGVVSGSTLLLYNPVNSGSLSIPFPAGNPLDCHNSYYGPGERIKLNTGNVCKIVACSR